MIYLDEEDYWKDHCLEGNIYDNTIAYLKHKGKTWDDVKFIMTKVFKDCDDDSDNCKLDQFVEITKEDFKTIAMDAEMVDLSLFIKIVGKDWFMSSDTDDGFFEMVEIPKRPSEVYNLPKELLINEENVDISSMMGITAEDDEW